MSSFQDGTWHFRAQVDPTVKQWEVQYRRDGIGRRSMFHTEAEAQKFADVCAGKVVKLEPRGKFRLTPITGGK